MDVEKPTEEQVEKKTVSDKLAEQSAQNVTATHYAITPELRTVLLDYLNQQPRKEVNNMCVVLENATPIAIGEVS
jgi:prophage DNA circulation protein